MKEIELKFLEINQKEVTRELKKLGAKKIFAGILENIYFDLPNKKLKKTGKTLRLRKEGKKNILTIKKNLKNKKAKICNEINLEINDFEKTKQAIKILGLIETKLPKRKRISFKFKNTRFDIDKYKDIPAFMEIESSSLEKIEKYRKILGLKKGKDWNNFKLLKYYGRI